MGRTVHCRKYGKDLPGLPAPPYPGPRGQEIYETVSRQAWQDWLKHQTLLINEKKLSMVNAEHRQYLQLELAKFLRNENVDQAEGYIPPTA